MKFQVIILLPGFLQIFLIFFRKDDSGDSARLAARIFSFIPHGQDHPRSVISTVHGQIARTHFPVNKE